MLGTASLCAPPRSHLARIYVNLRFRKEDIFLFARYF
jgi:hypothetical protein